MKNKKPEWVIDKERERKTTEKRSFWLFGIHAVRDALENPSREKIKLLITKNAQNKLENSIKLTEIETKIIEPKAFNELLDKNSVHQGVALEVKPLKWGSLSENIKKKDANSIVLLLDRISDPHNVGAILRSAEVFGIEAVIGTQRHSAPETGALAKAASGALERQPYLRIRNLSEVIHELKQLGFVVLGLDGSANISLNKGVNSFPAGPIAFVLGAEGPGLRDKTKSHCDMLVKIPSHNSEGSLNVSNAAAVAMYDLRFANTS